MDLSFISVAGELSRLGIEYSPSGDNSLKCRCPSPDHSDKNPSCIIDTETRKWKCFSANCGKSGDIVLFIQLFALKNKHHFTRDLVWLDLLNRYSVGSENTGISPDKVESWHDNIWGAKIFLRELYKRGLRDEDIKKYKLGFNDERITIPIIEDGIVKNVKQYLPGASSDVKMKSIRGFGRIRLWPMEQLNFGNIIVCGGELKAIVTAQRLNHLGYGAVTTTGGEGSWDPNFTEKFENKICYVMMDIDDAGIKASQKICRLLSLKAKAIYNVLLPLDKTKYPHGDVNDYFGAEKKSGENLSEILLSLQPYSEKEFCNENDEVKKDAINIPFNEVSVAGNAAKYISTVGTVVAVDTNPYLIPETVSVACSRDQKQCAICPIYVERSDKPVELKIKRTSSRILPLLECNKKWFNMMLQETLMIPQCKVCSISIKTWMNVEDARVSPRIEDQLDHSTQPVYFVGRELELNTDYIFTGSTYAHPKTQKSVFLADTATPAQDALSKYEFSRSDIESWQYFRPEKWDKESIAIKLKDIYDDMSYNVTRIYMRQDLHFAIDLTYHSVLQIDDHTKGWVETLIIGDSAQGKSECMGQMKNFYGLGEKVDCKNATVAGLLGGLQQIDNRWFATWGAIPLNDRRLVILEELKGASIQVISKLTDMRSSGVAELPKIERRRTNARTRLIALSNPRSDRVLHAFNYGMDSIVELIGAPEDIRRFDLCLILSMNDIDSEKIMEERSKKYIKMLDPLVCRRLILWAWTRTPDCVIFETDAQEAMDEEIKKMRKLYVDDVPLLDRGSIQQKMQRLSAALAVRTASISGESVLIRKCHVEYIADFLNRIYSSPTFGYLRFSESVMSRNVMDDEKEVRKFILSMPTPKSFISLMLHLDDIVLTDMCDAIGCDIMQAQSAVSFFVRSRAFNRKGRYYKKSPAFIDFLRGLEKEKNLPSAPSYISY